MGDEKSHQKIWKRRFDFFGRDFPPPNHNLRRTLVGWRKSRQKIENVGLIFLAVLFTPPPFPNCNHRRTLKFAILNLIKHFWEFTHHNIEYKRSAIMMGLGGNENHGQKKLKTSAGRWKNRLKCGREKSPVLVVRHQAAWPSRSTDLAGQLAVWTGL